MNVKKLAEEMFFDLKEEFTTKDPKCVGGSWSKIVEIDDVPYDLSIECFWDRSNWFEYQLTDMSDELVSEGTVLL